MSKNLDIHFYESLQVAHLGKELFFSYNPEKYPPKDPLPPSKSFPIKEIPYDKPTLVLFAETYLTEKQEIEVLSIVKNTVELPEPGNYREDLYRRMFNESFVITKFFEEIYVFDISPRYKIKEVDTIRILSPNLYRIPTIEIPATQGLTFVLPSRSQDRIMVIGAKDFFQLDNFLMNYYEYECFSAYRRCFSTILYRRSN